MKESYFLIEVQSFDLKGHIAFGGIESENVFGTLY